MIGRAVVAGLQDAGYTVDWVRDGAEAELALGHRVYDLALLDEKNSHAFQLKPASLCGDVH